MTETEKKITVDQEIESLLEYKKPYKIIGVTWLFHRGTNVSCISVFHSIGTFNCWKPKKISYAYTEGRQAYMKETKILYKQLLEYIIINIVFCCI